MVNRIVFVILISALIPLNLLMTSCEDGSDPPDRERFLYTSSNDNQGNNIIVMSIEDDGSLVEIATVPTGGAGDAEDGDFDGQHSLFIIPGTNYLLAVNAGEQLGQTGIPDGNGSVSVFEINNTTGLLNRIDQNPLTPDIDNIDSGGVRPVSVYSAVINGRTFVLVGNQYHNPFYGGETREDGLSNVRPGDPTDAPANTTLRNITALEFNNGVLSTPRIMDTYDSGNNGGPSQVAFSPDASKVAVSTWGIPQFGEGITTNADVQMPSRIYIYDVSETVEGLDLINPRFFEMEGVAGSIGFSWAPMSNYVFVANFNLALVPQSFEDFGVTVLSTGVNPELLNNAEIPSEGDEVCWTLLSPDGTRLYTASFAANIVSFFEVTPPFELDLRQSFTRTEVPPADTKDMFVTSDGNYFYVSGALMSHTISIYDIDSEGLLTETAFSPYRVPSSHPNGVNVSPEEQAFLGLVGF